MTKIELRKKALFLHKKLAFPHPDRLEWSKITDADELTLELYRKRCPEIGAWLEKQVRGGMSVKEALEFMLKLLEDMNAARLREREKFKPTGEFERIAERFFTQLLEGEDRSVH